MNEQQFKLKAIVASSGLSFDVDVNPTITGIELKQKIAEDISIDMDHQVLFTQNGIKLKKSKLSLQLSHESYNNDIFISNNEDNLITMAVGPHIYIFDKQHQTHPSIPSKYVLNTKDFDIDESKLNASPPPTLLSDEALRNHALFQSNNLTANKSILFRTLPKYEVQFDYHLNLALYIKQECLKKMTVSKKYVKQIQHQYKSLKVLLKHFAHLKELGISHLHFVFSHWQQTHTTHN